MVYEIKCSNCGKIVDFGGKPPEDKIGPTQKPENIIEFDGETYCRECVQELVEFGIGNIDARLDYLEDRMEEALDALGLSKAQEVKPKQE
ncbi:MAG: hypothetical protein ABEJ36_00915 [Candidatus Nanosalina sp.]